MYHYIDDAPCMTSYNLVFGSAFHETIESYLIDEKQAPALSERWLQCWDVQVEENGKDNISWDKWNTYKSMKRLGLKMFNSASILQNINGIQPAYYTGNTDKMRIEQYVNVPIPGVPVPLVGYIDVVHDDLIPGDFKTSSKGWYPGSAEKQIQPLFYLYALHYLGYDDIWDFRHHIYVKKTKKAVNKETRFTQRNIDWGIELLQQTWRGIKAGAFPAGSYMSWWCSEKYCEYWKHCGRV
jgi:hypothetical protein